VTVWLTVYERRRLRPSRRACLRGWRCPGSPLRSWTA